MLKTNQELHVSISMCLSTPVFIFFTTFPIHSPLLCSFPLLVMLICPPPYPSSPLSRLVPLPHFPVCDAAVQEERQRNKEREGEVESTSAVNEEMPVEKILEAEMAVEQKTELHADGSSGGSSVSYR